MQQERKTEDILRKLIHSRGTEYLRKGNLFVNAVDDMGGKKGDVRLLRYLVEVDGVNALLDAGGKPLAVCQMIYSQTVEKICETSLISTEHAHKVCTTFWQAVYNTEPPVVYPVSGDTPVLPPPKEPRKHDVFHISTYHPGFYAEGKVLGKGAVCNGQQFAVYNDDGEILGYCTARIYGNGTYFSQVTAQDNTVKLSLDGFSKSAAISYLISMPVGANTFDQAIADLEEDGVSIRAVYFKHEDPQDGIEIHEEYVFYVTAVKNGKIYGRSVNSKLDKTRLEQYVYRKGDRSATYRQRLNWQHHRAQGHDAFFEADCSNVRVGDVITDAILPDGYTLECEQISSWRYRLTFARVQAMRSSLPLPPKGRLLY